VSAAAGQDSVHAQGAEEQNDIFFQEFKKKKCRVLSEGAGATVETKTRESTYDLYIKCCSEKKTKTGTQQNEGLRLHKNR
jgi:hypothetical protein